MGFIQIKNKKLKVENKEIFLRGFGLGGWFIPEGYMLKFFTSCDRPRRIEKLVEETCGQEYSKYFWDQYYDKYISEFDIKLIAEQGFNCVRIPINSRTLFNLESQEISFNKTILVFLDRCINWCKNYGVYVILDMHGAPGGQTGQNIDDSLADSPDLFCNSVFRDQLCKCWRLLALHYSNEEFIVGYDLLNEPLPNFFNQYNSMVLPLYKKVISIIREVDVNHIIILEGVHWASDFSIFEPLTKKEVKDNRIMLQFHKYWNNPDEESLKEYIKISNLLETPLLMGEGGENNLDWYTLAFPMYEKLGIHWNFWTYKKMENSNSPVSFFSPREWKKVLLYLENKEEKQAVDFRSIFDSLLRNLQKVKINQEVFNSLNREAPLSIPCEGFDNFYIKDNYCSDVSFRNDTGISFSFEDGHKGKPDYQKMNGEPQKKSDNIIVRLTEKEWLEYRIHLKKGQNTISLKLKGCGSIEFKWKGSKVIRNFDSLKIIEDKFQIYVSEEVDLIQIYCQKGRLFLDRISFNMEKAKANIIYTSTFKNSFCVYEMEKEIVQDDSEKEDKIIDIHPEIEFQKFKGFGGAFTESSGFVFSRLSKSFQDEIINLYFGKEGLDYQFGRIPIDSCDFSLGEYSEIQSLEQIKSFSLERAEKYIIPFITKVNEFKGSLKLIFSPWSPPAFMKDNIKRIGGGKLKKEYYPAWAEYLVSYLKKYNEKGFTVFAISSQNEPNAVQKWDSCCYSSEDEACFIGEFLGPELSRSGLNDVIIIGWDHNKDRVFERTCELLTNPLAEKYINAIGFHWYSGDHFMALSMIKKMFPELMLISTESCVELLKTDTSHCQNGQRYAHEIIGDLKAGLNIFLDWNLLLDASGGPNYVGNYCVSPIMTDKDFSRINLSEEYYYLMHFSRFITDAVIIGSSSYTDKLEVVSFKKESTIFVVILNRNLEKQNCNIRCAKKILNIDIPEKSIATVSFKIENKNLYLK